MKSSLRLSLAFGGRKRSHLGLSNCSHLSKALARRSYLLRTVLAPGRRQFGIKVFKACCSLTQIGATSHTTNQLAPQAQFRPRAFEKCTALRHLNLELTEYDPITRKDACLSVVSCLAHHANSCFHLNVPDFCVERKGLWQDPICSAGWDSNGFSSTLELPFVFSFHKALTDNHVEAVVSRSVFQMGSTNTLWVSL